MKTISDFGYFDKGDGAFVLLTEPPRKWFNVHFNEPGDEELFAEVTNLGDGPVRVRDRAGNTVHLVGYDDSYIYIRDDETSVVFNPWGEPVVADVTERSCRFAPAKTVISGVCADLRTTQRVFAPRRECALVTTVFLENLSDRPRTVSVFAYARFQLGGTDHEGRGVGSEPLAYVKPEMGGVFAENLHRKRPPTDRYKGYLITINALRNANAHRSHFTRSDYSLSTPRILWGWNCDGRDGSYGNDNAGILQVTLALAPRGSERVDFVLGQTSCCEEVKSLRARLTPEHIDAACQEQEEIEKTRAASFTVRTGFENYDGLMNHFVKKQMVSYLIDKSGFRDNVQMDAALALVDYSMAESNFLRALSSQYPDGSVPHSFRPMNRLQYADMPCWISMTLPLLIKESGDLGLLDRIVPYFESQEKGTVWDHLLRSLRYLCGDTGLNGLCDQHFADWNDGLEPSGKTGKRESVMVTQQLCYGLLAAEELALRLGWQDVAREMRAHFETFKKRLNEMAWDGEWYIRTTCETGAPLGTHLDDQAKIFLNTQSWAVLSQTAGEERARQCMENVDRYLETDIGYLIAFPPCTRFDERIGKFSAIIPGHGTNGGAYCHAAGFKAVADCMLGRAEEAWRTFRKVAPDSPWNPLSRSKTEPFSFTNCYEAIPSQYGEAVYAWRTGTAGWFTMALIEWIFGVRRTYDGLMIQPCMSAELKNVSLTRHFRGASYCIAIDNSAGRCRGAREIWFDGKKLDGNVLPVCAEGSHEVRVVV